MALSLLLLLVSGAGAQGWRSWTQTSASPFFARNELVKIAPNYVNGRLDILTLMQDHPEPTSFALSFINGESRGLGRNSMLPPADSEEGYSYIPIDMVKPHEDTVYILANRRNEALNHESIYLLTYANPMAPPPAGQWALLASTPIYDVEGELARALSLRQLPDGNLAILGQTTQAGMADVTLTKISPTGSISWNNVYAAPATSENVVEMALAQDGSFYILYIETDAAQTPVAKIMTIDALGEMTASFEVPLLPATDLPQDMIRTADGDLVIAGHNALGAVFLHRLGADGQFRWRRSYPTDTYVAAANALIEDAGHNLLVAGSITPNGDTGSNGFLAKLSADGTPLWERTIPRQSPNGVFADDGFNDLMQLPSGGYLMAGARRTQAPPEGTFTYLVKTDSLGLIYGGNISGNVFRDLDANCALSAADAPIGGWVVQAVDGDRNYYGPTDADGNYSFPVEATIANPGNYVVSVFSPSPYWRPCQNHIPLFVEYQSSVTADFPMQADVECSYVQANIASTPFRICDTTQISVSYCNIGSGIAEDAYLQVTLDPALSFLSASVPPAAISGNVYTFTLGSIEVFDCGEIHISAVVNCDSAELGDILCIEADVFPDTLCSIPENWSGALVNGSYDCNDDELRFRLRNVGDDAMSGSLPYVIIEDAVLLMEGSFELGPDEEILSDPLPQNGAVYTLVAQQEPGAPGGQVIALSIAGCNATPPAPFGQYNGNPYTGSLCRTVVGSYDPNDKLAYPAGQGDDHLILPNTDILYTIRFQNTGTDTAFRVVIRDTLSENLNLASVQPVAASHPYRWNFEEQALVFYFYDIALPDSAANPEASQGFVQFRVRQRPHLPAGAYIGSSASIYFDFNDPIQTNVAFHTVAGFIDLVNEATVVATPAWAVSIAPNPVVHTAWIRLDGAPWPAEQLELQLFDATGRAVGRLPGSAEGFRFERGRLPAGLYLFSIEHPEGGWLASGKIMVAP